MFCPRCEINYHSTLKNCVNCNTKLLPGIICMECGTKNNENAKTCNLCGKLLTTSIKKKKRETSYSEEIEHGYERVCPNGHVNDNKNIFCSVCGEFLRMEQKQEIFSTPKPSILAAALNYITGLF